jgi:hypothetical protein
MINAILFQLFVCFISILEAVMGPIDLVVACAGFAATGYYIFCDYFVIV